MQMYVYYYDRYVKQDFEKTTIGILLCKEKKDTLVKLTLPEKANIYAPLFYLSRHAKRKLSRKDQGQPDCPFAYRRFPSTLSGTRHHI